MKLFISLIFFIFNYVSNKKIDKELKPNKVIRGLHAEINQLNFFKVKSEELTPNIYYKVMVHFLGSVKL